MGVQAGILNFDGSPVNREILARISQSVAAYGPDGETSMFDGPVGMLCRAFHTTPESRLEHQPFVSASGKTLTWDGRLDNRDELIAQLSAFPTPWGLKWIAQARGIVQATWIKLKIRR